MKRLAIALWLALATTAGAVEPGERLDDPALEARARELSKELRCLVCRNESIDESNAELARDLRLLVRERLVAGDTDEEVIAYLVDRFGEYVLLTPDARGINLVLWAAGPILLIIAAGGATLYLRRRAVPGGGADALTPEEEARLAEITKPGGERV